ncbi:hypothetical protein J2Y45_002964 [Dyadobacter sp. BE34]|uniref:Lipoprotein n=1 Tax=Dyadobacter fermentans TaxID=94254 RepID=A0ABU1QUH3_9BACT|nr:MULTISPECIES: hypothetical protein [Dyadobacter]MBZ1357829.1 hypothetical protein [Dyadobacter fermentans]MDR6804728.1 hypothetical protein [Dyadobacter fermentans]MDR7043513.1 hypothetical protein [Dyadobacter sp. BE242]MDR7197825.1 hypothetical protein [Dyadobacter sp. BE34]MDR7214742.1 hypothetical protein [Dyadobacter sp. BE31]
MMKAFKIISMMVLLSTAALTGCDTINNKEKSTDEAGSKSQTTPNDSSGSESRKDMGLGEDNQKDSLGYPSNQSNLNSDSTRKKHD